MTAAAAEAWEYRNEIIDNDGDGHQTFSAEALNEWGSDGWELVHVNPLQEMATVVLTAGDAAATDGESLPGGGDPAPYAGQTINRPKRVVCWLKRLVRNAPRWEYRVEVIDNDGDGGHQTFSAEALNEWGSEGWELQHVNPLQETSSVLTGEPVTSSSASMSLGGGVEYAGQTLTRPKRVVAWFKRPSAGGTSSASSGSGTSTSGGNDRLSDADEAAIIRTSARYAHAIDIGDGDLYAACFTPEGTMCQQSPGAEHTGRDALRALFATPDWLETGVQTAQLGQQHFNSSFVITPVPGHADRARMKSYLQCFNAGRCTMQGRCECCLPAAIILIHSQ
jgi:hypothetical protein